ncbi:MAG: VOC family protein [Candidatus Hydrogenedentes bacterium]|nr:VOC family protein [Candidatus Hydrogenedentota bacterium]
MTMQGITPCLWFDTQAEEAVAFYASLIEDSQIGEVVRYGEGAPLPAGTALTVEFTLQGQKFLALNGGPMFQFSPAVSFILHCETQEEVDHLWENLSDGGEKQRCGWLRDKYGLSWQVVPAAVGRMMRDPDPARRNRVMQAIMAMDRLDIAALEAAYGGP